ncbi:MAG: hypothetical protein H0T51_26505 [Pirellulales bacterium]|nr:hypothetical protein [Pirellulales bacterium]
MKDVVRRAAQPWKLDQRSSGSWETTSFANSSRSLVDQTSPHGRKLKRSFGNLLQIRPQCAMTMSLNEFGKLLKVRLLKLQGPAFVYTSEPAHCGL